MVGHRFVQAASSAGSPSATTSSCSARSRGPRTTGSRSPPSSRARAPRSCRCSPRARYDDPACELRARHRRSRHRPRGPEGHRSATARSMDVRRAGAGHRAAPVRAAGARATTPTAASSTAPSRTSRRSARPRAGATVGVVIGGGLLGLEAANALRQLGLETHVVEFAPRLMPVQVDEAGGASCPAHRGARPDRPHRRAHDRGASATSGEVTGLALERRARIDADVVVFSAGIRPRDELARDCRPRRRRARRHPGRRAVPHHATRTSSRSASARRRAAGCTAWSPPATRWPRSSSTRCSAAPGAFDGADMSTKLKLLGVDVAASATRSPPPRARSSSSTPTRWPASTRSSSSAEDGQRLLGGILVGDASAYGMLRPMVASGLALPGQPGGADPPGRAAAARRSACPTRRVVCSCNNVTKGDDLRAVDDGRATTSPASSARRPAPPAAPACRWSRSSSTSTSRPPGRVVDRGICEHFALTRQELFDLVAVHGYTTLRRDRRGARHAAAAATSASRPSPRSWPACSTATSSSERRRACRTPTTTSSPTSSATAPTRSSRGSPAARSRPRS